MTRANTELLIFSLVLIAPITQIVLGILRIKGKIGLSIILISVITFILGIGLSFGALSLLSAIVPCKNTRYSNCGVGEAIFIMFCFFVIAVSTIIVGAILGSLWYTHKKRIYNYNKADDPAVVEGLLKSSNEYWKT